MASLGDIPNLGFPCNAELASGGLSTVTKPGFNCQALSQAQLLSPAFAVE